MNKPKGKGQQYLIEAAKLLKPKYPKLRYLIVGAGEIKNELENKPRNLVLTMWSFSPVTGKISKNTWPRWMSSVCSPGIPKAWARL